MAVTTNYSGRTVDLLSFQNTAPTGERRVHLGFGNTGKVTTGIQKLCQKFTQLFLTDLGSNQYSPNNGTDFILRVQQGAIRDESDVVVEFSVAAEKVRRVLALSADNNVTPDDERFVSATLSRFTLDKANSKLSLYVIVNSAAGESRDIVLPVPYAIK
jgi:hypothetical protein